MDYAFHCYNTLAETGATLALSKLLRGQCAPPVVLCIGSDLSLGDSLGPLVGTFIEEQLKATDCYLYGTLKKPVTAKEVTYLTEFIKNTHPRSKIVAVDASVGAEGDVGLIKLYDEPLSPGTGANKSLGEVGDVSFLGILSKKDDFSYSNLNLTRLNVVYRMAKVISTAILNVITEEGIAV